MILKTGFSDFEMSLIWQGGLRFTSTLKTKVALCKEFRNQDNLLDWISESLGNSTAFAPNAIRTVN